MTLRGGYAYFGIAVGAGATVAYGFWPSYFGPLLAGGVERPWIVHLHAAVFGFWIALFVAQAWLASTGRRRAHRRLGRLGAAFGVVVLCAGVAVSLMAPALRVRAGQLPLELASRVVLYNLTDVMSFAIFFVAAILARRRPELHMRLMLSATVALSGAAVGRVIQGRLLYVVVWLAPVLASMLVDVLTTRRVYAVSLGSLAVFAVMYQKVSIISSSVAVTAIGRALMAPFL